MIDVDQVKHIAALANLDLDPAAVETFRGQLQKILDYVEMLNSLDVRDVAPMAHRLDRGQPLRPDEIVPPLPREVALSNAPDFAAGQFRVPRVLKG